MKKLTLLEKINYFLENKCMFNELEQLKIDEELKKECQEKINKYIKTKNL